MVKMCCGFVFYSSLFCHSTDWCDTWIKLERKNKQKKAKQNKTPQNNPQGTRVDDCHAKLFPLFTKFNQIRIIFNIVPVHCWSLYISYF